MRLRYFNYPTVFLNHISTILYYDSLTQRNIRLSHSMIVCRCPLTLCILFRHISSPQCNLIRNYCSPLNLYQFFLTNRTLRMTSNVSWRPTNWYTYVTWLKSSFNHQIPFGPFIASGYIATLFFASQIQSLLQWYL